MKISKTLKKSLESLLLALLPLVCNLFFLQDPGFLHWYGLPYLLIPLVSAGTYGLGWGVVQGVLSCLAGFVLFPWAQGFFSEAFLRTALTELRVSGPLALAGLFAVVFFHNNGENRKRSFLQRLRRAVRKISLLSRTSSSLQKVNRVLESRVASQKDSITMLRSQVKKMASLNLDQALQTLLETVQLFTEMKSGSVWVLDRETKTLTAAAVLGWDEGQIQEGLDPEHSVVGYVYRNGKPFSVRMVLGGQEFAKLDFQRNILSFPIRVRGRVWGVFNIEELPFERYSLYTESVLEIILSLIEPYLAEILDHETLFQTAETDPDTGLPLVTQLFRTLDRELERLGRDSAQLSLILIEISNFADLEKTWSRAELKGLFSIIKDELDRTHEMKSRAFHFKNDNQLAFVINGLDLDGTSFLCLDLLSLIPSLGLNLGGTPVPLEVLVGFSAAGDASRSGEALVQGAETLLSLQRLE